MAHASEVWLAGEADERPAGVSSGPAAEPLEELILGIWREMLGHPVGVQDDLVALGAHALVPMVVSRIRNTVGVEISTMDVFESPTVAALASLVAARSVARAPAPARVVTARPPDAEPVLSFDQRRLWMESQLLPGVVYNVHGRRKLVGPLDIAILEQSVRAILTRHEALRTRFPTVGGQPVQIVDEPDQQWRLRVEDFTGTGGDRTGEACLRLDQEATTPFDLARGPLLRCLLIKLSDTEHLLGVTVHHIVSDARSIVLFVRELSALYRAGGDPGRANLSVLPVQYRDYAVWQRARLVGDELERQVSYWRRHLSGAPPVLALPAVMRPSTAQGADADRVRCVLPEAETETLHELCRTHGVTPFMALLAALATVLGRWSGQTDVVIGVPLSGRNHRGTEDLIGSFLNILPFRVDLSGGPSFAELLRRVRQIALDGYAHGDAPFDVLVEDLKVARDPRRTPLFEVVLNVIASPESEQVSGLVVEPMDTPALFSRFDLSVTVQQVERRLRITLDFAADRCDPELLTILIDQLRALLSGAARDPARPLPQYSFVAAEPALDIDPRVVADKATIDLGLLLGQPGGLLGRVGRAAGTGADWAVDRFELRAEDRFAVLSGVPEHLVSALSSAWHAGASLVLGDDWSAADIEAAAGRLRGNEVTVVFTTTPTLRALLARVPAGHLPALRYAFVDNTGELLPHDVEALRAVAPGCRCVGVYRVGGDGTPLAAYPVPEGIRPDRAPLRIALGEPVSGAGLQLPLPAGQPAAVGEVGEICSASGGTGDLARRWPDGSLEFVGRAGTNPAFDPLETVAVLRDLPEVRDALVCRTTRSDGSTGLTGYLAGTLEQPDTVAILNHLRTRLPAYLVPDQLLVLDQLPRNARGEYDLPALPAGQATPGGTERYMAPRTPMETQLTGILQELLGRERIGVHDSFFELGGFSLLATHLTTRIRTEFGVDLALRDVFESPTVDELAQQIIGIQGELSGVDNLEALLAETERLGPQAESTGSVPEPVVGGQVWPAYQRAVARLRDSAVFTADKPDETPETTARALWYAAAGNPRPATAAALPLPPLSPAQEHALAGLVERRVAGEPLAYLTGRESFLGLEFLTGTGALVPRRETELLGGLALSLAKEIADSESGVRILDLGTGSGNLAVSLAVLEPRARVWACDLEAEAVAVARRNAEFHHVADRVTVAQGDLFGALDRLSPRPGPFDLVVCNPPYLPTHKVQSMPVEVGGFEPAAAFDGGEVGLSILYRLIAEAPAHLVPGGWVCFELGAGMGRVLEKRLAANGGYGEVRKLADQDGMTRAILSRRLP
jgi:HemK-like putative methylase